MGEVSSVGLEDYTPESARRATMRIRDIVKDLDAASKRWLEASVARHYARSAAKARTALEILGKKSVRKRVYDRRFQLIEDTAVILRRANASIVATAARILALTAMAAREIAALRQSSAVQEFEFEEAERHVATLARRAVAREESAGTLLKKVRSYLIDLIGDGKFVDIKGRRYDMKKYSKMVAHTALAEAQTAATIDLCNEYDNDLVQWSDHGTECPECEVFEGNVYSVSGRHPRYPYLDAEPPIHPNCEHALLPTSDIALEVAKKYGRYQTPGQLIGG